MLPIIVYLTQNEEIIQSIQQFIENWQDSRASVLVNTSGSTGSPKTISLKKEFMRNSALASGRFFHFKEGQRIRLAISPETIGGKMLLLRGILHNMKIEIVQPSRNPLGKCFHPIDFISMVPYQLEYILDHCPEELSSVKTILLGGAPVSKKLREKIQSVACDVFLGFGMTETISHVALMDLKRDNVFHAMDGISFSTDENDCLFIHAPQLGIHSLKTHDIIDLKNEKSFVWKGRLDFVINSAGVKIHPEIVERKLVPFIQNRYFIIGEKNAVFGEIVVLVIEGEEGKKIDFRTILSKYEIPKRIEYISRFEETKSGKINRILTKSKLDATQNNSSL